MTSVHHEVERKYALADDAVLPDLAGVPGVARVGDPARHSLEATYLDTADLRLAAARTTLRRRTGGEDAGWHLKLPSLGAGGSGSAGDRQEVRLPLDAPTGDGSVPPELERLVWAATRGEPLVPVARLVTDRTVRLLHDADGRVLAEVADDLVTAVRLAGAEQTGEAGEAGGAGGAGDGGDGAAARAEAWREAEVELVEVSGAEGAALLDAVEDRLRAAGVRSAASPSKLARALGGTPPSRDTAHRAGLDADRLGPGSSAGEVLLARLAGQVDELVGLDPHVRLDAPDAVHRARVATRRLRSALKTFRPVLEREPVRAVRDELRWFAGVLGGARDAEVLRERLAGAARADAARADAAWSPEAAEGAALAVEEVLGQEHEAARAQVVEAMEGERYRALLGALERLVTDPPLTDRAARPASEVLLRRARRAHRELRDLVERALAEDGPADTLVHEARKAGKRARYAAEALAPAWPAAQGYVAATKHLQSELGEHQDSVVARAALQRVAGTSAGGPHAFALGRLHALEQASADRAEGAAPALWRAARKRSARRWMEG